MTVNYAIYQLKHTDRGMNLLHLPYNELKNGVDAKDYEKVWSEDMDFTISKDLQNSEFEKNGINAIVKKLSNDLPEGFYGHMPSVSDIIVLNNEEAWYIDAKGYKLLPAGIVADLFNL